MRNKPPIFQSHIDLQIWPLTLLKSLLPVEDVWLAGGPVRDLLLTRRIHDWDFAVAGQARSLARTVANTLNGAYYTLDAERDAGRVIIENPTTQHPVTLDFARLRGDTIEDDLRLRDFTINAMALTLNGVLIDPTSGQRDLQAHQIRQTNATSLRDDPARLLRAVRQAGQLNFNIEATTFRAIRDYAACIREISPERIRDELLKILRLPQSSVSFQTLADLDLLTHILPEIATLPHTATNVWNHTLAMLSAQNVILDILQGHPPSEPDWVWKTLIRTLAPFRTPLLDYLAEIDVAQFTRSDYLRWGTLLHNVGKGQTQEAEKSPPSYEHAERGARITKQHLKALHFPNKATTFIESLVKAQSCPSVLSAAYMYSTSYGHSTPYTYDAIIPDRRAIYRFYRDTGEAGVAVVLLALADTASASINAENCQPPLSPPPWKTLLNTTEILLTAYFKCKDKIVTPPLLLSGHDLLSLGIPSGPEIGHLLEILREAQAAGEINTQEEARTFIRTQCQHQRKKHPDCALQKPQGRV